MRGCAEGVAHWVSLCLTCSKPWVILYSKNRGVCKAQSTMCSLIIFLDIPERGREVLFVDTGGWGGGTAAPDKLLRQAYLYFTHKVTEEDLEQSQTWSLQSLNDLI